MAPKEPAQPQASNTSQSPARSPHLHPQLQPRPPPHPDPPQPPPQSQAHPSPAEVRSRCPRAAKQTAASSAAGHGTPQAHALASPPRLPEPALRSHPAKASAPCKTATSCVPARSRQGRCSPARVGSWRTMVVRLSMPVACRRAVRRRLLARRCWRQGWLLRGRACKSLLLLDVDVGVLKCVVRIYHLGSRWIS